MFGKRNTAVIYVISLLVGSGFWLAHSLFDYLFFYEADFSFWEIFITDVPARQLWVRVVVVIIALAAGIVIDMLTRRRNRIFEELQKQKEELRKNEENLRITFDSIGDAVISTDRSGKVVDMNPIAEKLTGYTIDESRGKNLEEIFRIINTLNRKPLENPVNNVISGGEIVGMANNTSLISKDGKEHNISDSGAPIKNSKNEIVGVVLVFRDISEKYEMDLKLRESELRYRTIFESANDGIFLMDGDIFVDCNPKVTELFACDESDIIGHTPFEFSPEKQPDGETSEAKAIKKINAALDNEPQFFEWTHKKKTGEIFHAEVVLNKFEVGPKVLIMAIVRDISERKAMMADLRRAKEGAEKSNRLKTEFLAQMSHEVRTPLNVLLSSIEFLKEITINKIESEYRELFDCVKSSSRRITHTIDNILNVSELQTGSYEIVKREIDLDAIISDLLSEFKYIVESKGLEISYHRETGNTKINADEYSVKQIFANLIDNAVKYTKRGKINLTLKNGNGKLLVEVTDTGIGINPDFMPHLFDFFRQEEQGYSREFEGNGLGLALVKQYCELNKAEIKVESEKNVGSKFTVSFNIN